MSNEVRLSEDLKRLLTGDLQWVLSLETLNSAASYISSTIKKRTRDGVFLNAGYNNQYSAGWKRKRGKRGRQVTHVDLFFEGQMLDAMRSHVEVRGSKSTVTVGYIDGMSEVQASLVAGYHDQSGAGKNRIIREFVGVTQAEADKLLALLYEEMF